MIKPEKIWWGKVPVAANFIDRCVSEAMGFHPSYINRDRLPWADQFMRMTGNAIRAMNQNYTVFTVDGAEFDSTRHASVLDLMVKKLGHIPEYDSTIRSVGRALNDSVVFFLVRAVSKDQLTELKNIAWEAEQLDINLRLIVLTDVRHEEDEAVKTFRYYNNDIHFFVLNMLLEKNSIDELLNYRVGLATLLADRDAEKAAACCEEIDNCIYSPNQVCTWLDGEKLDALVRKAKIRFLMPDLEMARINFGKRVKDRFGQGVLPHPDIVNGERVLLSLDELEFRHFKFISRDSRKLALTQDEKDMLQVLYDGRNALAHIGKNDDYLTVDRIRELVRTCDRLER